MIHFNGDVLKAKIPDDSIHLIITSPPYNVGIEYDTHSDNMEYTDYITWLTEVFVFLYDKLVDGGRLCINIAPTGIKNFAPIHHDLITQLRATNYRFVTEIIWYKQNRTARTAWGSFCSPSCPYVLPSWEYIYVLQKGEKLIEDKKPDITKAEFMKFVDGFWNIKPETKKRGHPVPFPEELVYRLIKLYTYPGDMVCDPFSGSGTVQKVAREEKRLFQIIELSEEYYKLAMDRVYGQTEACPHCKSRNTRKHGTIIRAGEKYQRYDCLDCKKSFSPRSRVSDIILQARNTDPENLKKLVDQHT
jgi:site-specific DNA-methyltransferase (adenine-specific)